MVLKAGYDNEKLNDGSESYIDLYEWDMPEETKQKIADLKIRMRII